MELFHFGEQRNRDSAAQDGGCGAGAASVRCVSRFVLFVVLIYFWFLLFSPPTLTYIFLFFFFTVQITRNVPRFICLLLLAPPPASLPASSVPKQSQTAQIKVENIAAESARIEAGYIETKSWFILSKEIKRKYLVWFLEKSWTKSIQKSTKVNTKRVPADSGQRNLLTRESGLWAPLFQRFYI